MQRRYRHNPRPPEEPTNYNLDMYRSTFGSHTIQDPRTWIRQGYVEDTDAASTLSDAIDQLSPYDWPDDAPDTIVFEGCGHYLELSREEHYELFPRQNNYRDDGGTHPIHDSSDQSYLSDFTNLRPSNTLLRTEAYSEWYRKYIFARWLEELPRLHSVQLTLAELIDIWQKYRHHEVHNFNSNTLNSNEHNYTSSSSSDGGQDSVQGYPNLIGDYPQTVLTPPGTPTSGSSLDTATPPIDHDVNNYYNTMLTADMTPPSSPVNSDIGDGADM
jgi:hypothetical protein